MKLRDMCEDGMDLWRFLLVVGGNREEKRPGWCCFTRNRKRQASRASDGEVGGRWVKEMGTGGRDMDGRTFVPAEVMV